MAVLYDYTHVYNDDVSPQNQTVAKTVIPWFLCPSNALRSPIRTATARPTT